MQLNWFNKTQSALPVAERQEPIIEAAAVPAVRNDNEARTYQSITEFTEAMGFVASSAGPVVTSKTAMRVAIVYACIRLLAGAMATMPRTIYRKTAAGRDKDSAHPLSVLLNLQPTPLMSAAMFWEFITACMLLEGDGFAVILRDAFGEPVELLPVSANNVHVEQRGNRLVYFIVLNGVHRGFDQDDILHFAGFGFNGTRSLSAVKYAAGQSVGMAMAMESFAGDFFKNGVHSDFAVIKDSKWGPEDQAAFREAWAATYGGTGKGKKPLTIGKGLSIEQLKISAADSQLLESREFENINICTAIGVPGFLVNQGKNVTAWGTGMAEMSTAFVRYTLSPHMVRWDQELNRKLFMRTEQFVETNPAGLMRGTLKERNEAYKSALGGSNVPGYMSINEVRQLENMPPMDSDLYDQPYDPRLVGAAPFAEPTTEKPDA
ncbi:phage portal protein [Gilvimarinus agarilyticus]|uniref:phage portal protein n=1 Tax=Gilvimarinus agarilyticus TaxID=679259 RepID=UPI000696D721|nr:phage portal protein [Gilvimarinus agarilyticus]